MKKPEALPSGSNDDEPTEVELHFDILSFDCIGQIENLIQAVDGPSPVDGWNRQFDKLMRALLQVIKKGGNEAIEAAFVAGRIRQKFDSTTFEWNISEEFKISCCDAPEVAKRYSELCKKNGRISGKYTECLKRYDSTKTDIENYDAAMTAGYLPTAPKTGQPVPYSSYRVGLPREAELEMRRKNLLFVRSLGRQK